MSVTQWAKCSASAGMTYFRAIHALDWYRQNPKSRVASATKPPDQTAPWPTPFSPTCCLRFPNAAARCWGVAAPPTPGRTLPNCWNCARRCYRAAARLPESRSPATSLTATTRSTAPAGSVLCGARPRLRPGPRKAVAGDRELARAAERRRCQRPAFRLRAAAAGTDRRLNRAPGGTSALVRCAPICLR